MADIKKLESELWAAADELRAFFFLYSQRLIDENKKASQLHARNVFFEMYSSCDLKASVLFTYCIIKLFL